MDINFSTNATLSLLNQVGRSSSDPQAAPVQDTASDVQLSDAALSNSNLLMIRDTLAADAYVYGFINMSDDSLNQLGGYLTNLRDTEIALALAADGSAEQAQLQAQKTQIERQMSVFVGQSVHMDDFQMQAGISDSASQNSFFDIINIYDSPNSQDNLAGLLSVVEVDMATIFENAHSEASCPICNAANASPTPEDGSLEAYEVAYNSTGVTNRAAATTSDSELLTLRMGVAWNLTGSDTLSYSFYDGTTPYDPAYNGGSTASVFTDPVTGTQAINALGSDNSTNLTTIFERWDKTVDFDFVEVVEDGTNVGEIRLAWTDGGTPDGTGRGGAGGRAAFAYGPYGTVAAGDVWFETYDIDTASTVSDFDPTGTGDDGFSYFAAIHEVGHALGLSHPFGGSAGGDTLPIADDTIRNSVMSYTQIDRNVVVDFTAGGSTSATYRVYSTTPMLLDVEMMELLYGAETTSDGDTTYNFTNDATRLQPIMMQTIADSGGTDTIDASNQTRTSTIDLTPGSFSSIGLYTEAEQIAYWNSTRSYTVSSLQGIFASYDTQAQSASNSGGGVAYAGRKAIYTGEDNLAIAHNAQIENAIGGSAGDTITGNSLGNAIEGRGGNDTINAAGGDDAITGGTGDDTIDGGDGEDTAILSGNSSDYTFDYSAYDKTTQTGTITVTDNQGGRDGTDTYQNVEYLQFSATETSARGAQARTSSVTATDMSAMTHQMTLEIDGGTAVNVSFSGRDYATLGLSAFASDMQTAINAALAADGQTASVTVTVNSPLTITSDNTTASSAVQINSLSADLQAALGTITQEGAISVGDTVYYNLGGGFVTTVAPSSVPSVSSPTSTPSIPSSSGGSGSSSSGGSGGSGGAGGSGSTGGTTTTGNGLGGTGLPNLNRISVLTQEDTVIAIQTIDRAINQISQNQAKLGAIQNRLQHNIDNLHSQVLQTEMAKGRIMDADFASETAKLVKDQILMQAAMQAMGMAHQSKQGVMTLVR